MIWWCRRGTRLILNMWILLGVGVFFPLHAYAYIIHKNDAKKSFKSGTSKRNLPPPMVGPAPSNYWHRGTCCRIPSSLCPQRLLWFWLNLKQKDGTWTLGWMCDVYQTMSWYFFAEMRNISRKMRNIKTRTTSGIGRVWHFCLKGTLIYVDISCIFCKVLPMKS